MGILGSLKVLLLFFLVLATNATTEDANEENTESTVEAAKQAGIVPEEQNADDGINMVETAKGDSDDDAHKLSPKFIVKLEDRAIENVSEEQVTENGGKKGTESIPKRLENGAQCHFHFPQGCHLLTLFGCPCEELCTCPIKCTNLQGLCRSCCERRDKQQPEAAPENTVRGHKNGHSDTHAREDEDIPITGTLPEYSVGEEDGKGHTSKDEDNAQGEDEEVDTKLHDQSNPDWKFRDYVRHIFPGSKKKGIVKDFRNRGDESFTTRRNSGEEEAFGDIEPTSYRTEYGKHKTVQQDHFIKPGVAPHRNHYTHSKGVPGLHSRYEPSRHSEHKPSPGGRHTEYQTRPVPHHSEYQPLYQAKTRTVPEDQTTDPEQLSAQPLPGEDYPNHAPVEIPEEEERFRWVPGCVPENGCRPLRVGQGVPGYRPPEYYPPYGHHRNYYSDEGNLFLFPGQSAAKTCPPGYVAMRCEPIRS